MATVPEAQAPPLFGACGGHLAPGAGHRVWFLGNLMTIKLGLGSSDAMTLIEAELQPGHAPPLHLHEHEDEMFYVLAGGVRFRCGEEEFDARAGEFVFVPKTVRHAFKVGAAGARTLMVSNSSALARFMHAGGISADGAARPAPSEDDLRRVVELAPRYDMNVVGPPLA